jgi:hypothetical protein
MWFLLGRNVPPVLYYGDPVWGGGLFRWYDAYAWYPGGFGGYYNEYRHTTINHYTEGPAASIPPKLNRDQTNYLKASPSERPGISSKILHDQPETKTVRVTPKPGSSHPGSSHPGSSSPESSTPGSSRPKPGASTPGSSRPQPGSSKPKPGSSNPQPSKPKPGSSNPQPSKPKPPSQKPGSSKPGTSKPKPGSSKPGTSRPAPSRPAPKSKPPSRSPSHSGGGHSSSPSRGRH